MHRRCKWKPTSFINQASTLSLNSRGARSAGWSLVWANFYFSSRHKFSAGLRSGLVAGLVMKLMETFQCLVGGKVKVLRNNFLPNVFFRLTSFFVSSHWNYLFFPRGSQITFPSANFLHFDPDLSICVPVLVLHVLLCASQTLFLVIYLEVSAFHFVCTFFKLLATAESTGNNKYLWHTWRLICHLIISSIVLLLSC